ncbi:MAG: hypothetical protein ACU0BF_00685 [Paracoccaceae bacterium]
MSVGWSLGAPPVPVLSHVANAAVEAQPYLQLRGSDGVPVNGTGVPQIAIDAAALFPIDDFSGAVLRPAAFGDATPDPRQFAAWHVLHQIDWMQANVAPTPVPGTGDAAAVPPVPPLTARHASIGTAPSALSNLNVMLSVDETRLIRLDTLDLSTIARLPLEDQRALTSHPAYDETIALRLGVKPASGGNSDTERTKHITDINALILDWDGNPAFDPTILPTAEVPGPDKSEHWPNLFVGQAQILKDRLAGMAIFHPGEIALAIDALSDRFERLERLQVAADRPAPPAASNGYTTGRNAIAGPDGFKAARDITLAAEIRLYDLTWQAQQIALTGIYNGRKLDPPAMTFVLQTFENHRAEAEVEAKTEELNLRNALLLDYNAMQRLLTRTLASFDAAKLADPDQTETKPIGGGGALSDADKALISMFDKTLASGNANPGHPVEDAKTTPRPTIDMVTPIGFGLGLAPVNYEKQVWDQYALRLSQAIQTLGDDNQILMDGIGQDNREKNRHYQLASNTLNKMTGILRAISNP